jgi:hypothetical protein
MERHPSTSKERPVDVTVAFELNDADQNAKGRWIESCLVSAGFIPRDWHPYGGNWVVDLDAAAAATDEPCVIVITPATSPGSPATVLWQAIIASGDRRPVIPVYFDGAQPPALLRTRVPVHVDDADVGTAREQLVGAVTAAARGTRFAHTEGHHDVSIAVDFTKDLPRLRRLTERTMRDAGTVGDQYFEWDVTSTGPSLYVRRDVQDDVIVRMRDESLTVISGDPGVGKTSLLWGVANELLLDPNAEVLFIRAAMLTARGAGGAVVTPERLQNALHECHRLGKAAYVLIDTADVLVGDDADFLSLMEIIDVGAAEHASTIVTSRQAQADAISSGRTPAVQLDAYALDESESGQPSEFARAVASHATAYCRRPGDTSELAEQIGLTAVREQTLGRIARHPLTLRMLFELYAPGLVPESVDATELFEKYWTDRVFSDRRGWVPTDSGGDADLTATAMRIAHHMLKTGVPEARVADLPAGSAADRVALDADVVKLCARGVGQHGELGTFTFFHQTFFEFASAKDLLSRDTSPLAVLATRVVARPSDYFLQAVLEQTWVCAYRLDGHHHAAANELTVAVLTAPQSGDHSSAPLGLRRCATRVGAQSVLDQQTRTVIGAALEHEPESGVVRDFLALLPRPGRAWTAADTTLLARCCARSDTSWHSVVDVLHRIAASSPKAALRAFQDITHERPLPLLGEEGLMRKQTRDFLSPFVATDTEAVLDLLALAVRTDPHVRRVAVLEKVFDIVDRDSNAAAAVLRWARSTRPSQTPTAEFVRKAANLHRRAIEDTLAGPIDGERAGQLLSHFSTDLETIQTSTGHAAINPTAACWGLLLALGRRDDPNSSTPESGGLVSDALNVLSCFDGPRVHEQIHHGWLTDLVNHSPTARHWARKRLAAGLPAAHGKPADIAERWADSVRRTLGRVDIARGALVDVVSGVCDDVAQRWDAERLWTDPDLLLRLLLASACAGIPDAQATLTAVTHRSLPITDEQVGILVQQAQRLQPADAENRAVIELLVTRKDYEGLKQLSMKDPTSRWDADAGYAPMAAALLDILSVKQKLRRSASSFLKYTTNIGVVPFPAWEDVAHAIRLSPDPVVRADLAEVANNAANAGGYDAGPLIAYLWTRLAPALELGALSNEHELPHLRRIQVSLLALHGDESTHGEAIDLAFLPEVEKEAIKGLAGYFIPEQRTAGPIPVETSIDVLIEVGKRLAAADVTNRASREVAGAWKSIFRQMFNHADDESLLRVIDQIPNMAPHYAVAVVNRLPRRTGLRLAAALVRLVSLPVPAQVQRSIEFYLKRGDNPAGGWPELDADLAHGSVAGVVSDGAETDENSLKGSPNATQPVTAADGTVGRGRKYVMVALVTFFVVALMWRGVTWDWWSASVATGTFAVSGIVVALVSRWEEKALRGFAFTTRRSRIVYVVLASLLLVGAFGLALAGVWN